tara:strand:- start:276 stop:1766 length:1491 start_codon:yes stop_codon:yes gene_type:complete
METKVNLKEIINNRIVKLKEIKDNGVDPFPHNFNATHEISEVLDNKEDLFDENISIVGRIISQRKMGKACFLNLVNEHSKIQLYIKNINLSDDTYDLIVRKLDIGDFIGVGGGLFYTKTNELSLKVDNLTLLSKSIRPLPNLKEKDGKTFFSFDDKELRYRNRHLDLIANDSIGEIFKLRAKIISRIRFFLDDLGYLEVETPILQPIYGGANAKPFKTYHNTLEQNLFLRIADELYLKRLIIGGINKVYEISKNFRNEGMDKNHNPEFTMLEFYCAYSDVYDMLDLTENMIRSTVQYLQSNFSDFVIEIDFMKKFEIHSFFEKLNEESRIDFKTISKDEVYKILLKNKVTVDEKMSFGKLLDKAFSHFVEPKLISPTFIVDYPLELSPLAKQKRDSDENIVERFELFVSGMEIANSFSELNDPLDQAQRMGEQNKLRELGDEEAQTIDYNFLNAMECGMPPCGGVGIGIDRLVMLLTGQKSIKDVILFPAMRNIEV